MKFVVLDTNVVVSAMLSQIGRGHPASIVKRLTSGEFIAVYSPEIFDEYEEVLRRKKFAFRPEDVDYMLELIKQHGICQYHIQPMSFSPKCKDLFDQPFYDLAHGTDSILITGNAKNFPPEIRIMTPAEFDTGFASKR